MDKTTTNLFQTRIRPLQIYSKHKRAAEVSTPPSLLPSARRHCRFSCPVRLQASDSHQDRLLATTSNKSSVRPLCVFTSLDMEIEVKLKLRDAAAHQQVARLLAPFRLATHLQENVFFDGSNGELSGARAVLRLRFYDGDSRCVVSLKGKAVIADGISRMDEEEEDVDSVLGRACIVEPWRLVGLECGIVKRVLAEYGCKGFVCLGGFRNVRGVFDWQGLKIELDETQYDFGTCYEIECESSDPERAKKVIEGFLVENGVPFTNSAKSKFAIFRSGKLPDEN